MKNVVYWEKIEEVGLLKGFFGTWFMVIFKPKSFFEAVKSSEKILPPLLFAWLNMFLSALFLSFIYGPLVGYVRPKVSEIGFMIIIIPVIFILPIFIFSSLVHWGLCSNSVKSSARLVFRLFCYSFTAVFLFFEMGVPLARYPFSFYLLSVWVLIMILFGLKNIFQINLYEAMNSSIFFIIILFTISTIGFVANNRIIASKINKSIDEGIAFNEKNVQAICNLVKERAELYKNKHGVYPLKLAELINTEFNDQPSEIKRIVYWQIPNESEIAKLIVIFYNNTGPYFTPYNNPPYGYFYMYKRDGKSFIFKAVPKDMTSGKKNFEITEKLEK